jgi:hypothetical protein
VIEAVAALVLTAAVIWGATVAPGRPFSWTMYSGSSKTFLWLSDQPARLWASTDALRLTPDSHYLLEADLRRLAADGELPAVDGLIVGSRGSWKVACDADRGLQTERISRDEDLAELVAALRRTACRQS